jgi:glutathionylspermidine synthase
MTCSIAVVPIGSADPLRDPSLARELTRRFLVWDAFVAGKRRVDVHPLLLPATLDALARKTAETVVREVGAAAHRAHLDPEERARYGFDDDALRLASASHAAGDDAALVRVDLLLETSGRWKACEINADCPGGHNEATGLPLLARAAGFAEGRDPTHVLDELAARLRTLAAGGAVALLHATGYAEDLQVCALVARALERAGTRAILASPLALHLRGGDLCIGGEPVRALYRYFPIEWMAGQRNLDAIVHAVESGRVRTLSSFAQAFVQSKLALARAWESAATLENDGGARPLREYLPESRDLRDVAPEDLRGDRPGWVIKRAMGRVGDQVFVGRLAEDAEWTAVVDATRERAASGEAWIAQRFVEQQPVSTPWGDRLVTLGAYVLDGRFVGYFARITSTSHVSHDALCVPVFAAA